MSTFTEAFFILAVWDRINKNYYYYYYCILHFVSILSIQTLYRKYRYVGIDTPTTSVLGLLVFAGTLFLFLH